MPFRGTCLPPVWRARSLTSPNREQRNSGTDGRVNGRAFGILGELVAGNGCSPSRVAGGESQGGGGASRCADVRTLPSLLRHGTCEQIVKQKKCKKKTLFRFCWQSSWSIWDPFRVWFLLVNASLELYADTQKNSIELDLENIRGCPVSLPNSP